MSRENVERVRVGYEAFNRGDVDAALEGFSPDTEWRVLGVLPEDEVYRGREGVRRFWQMWHDSFEGFQIKVEEIIDAGDRIVVLIAATGSGRGSGAEVRTPTFAQVWTYDRDKLVRVDMMTEADALEAAGRRE